MGAIGGLLGTAGGVNGTGISGPQGANIQQGVTPEQVGQSYTGANNALGQQQALLAALQGQRGIQNQNAVFNQGQNLSNQLGQLNGAGNIGQAINAQQNLANQYQNVANGTGPNPAQAMLANATGANIANQGALMAGQRGAGSNVGLLARQVAQQGASTQQQAAGQAAEMQANQQLNAMQGLSGINQSVAGMGGSLLGAQQAQQQALAGQAAGQIANQMGATTAYNQAQQAEQGQLLGALANQNNNAVGMQGNINSANAGLAGTNMQGQQGIVGGLMNAVGAGGKTATGAPPIPPAGADGGMIVKKAAGGPIGSPEVSFGQFLAGWGAGAPPSSGLNSEYQNMIPSSNAGADSIKQGGKRMGERFATNPEQPTADTAAGGGSAMAPLAMGEFKADGGLASSGGHVAAKSAAQKAVKSGNSYDNDKIPAMLSEGEIVIPRSVLQSKDPVAGAAEFVRDVIARRGKK